MYYCYYGYYIHLYLILRGIFCFTPWIKHCVPSLSSTLTCQYGTPPMKSLLTCWWTLKSTCKECLFDCMMSLELTVCRACQTLFKGRIRQEDVYLEQEYRSFDRRHFLEYGIQNWDARRKGIMHVICIMLIIYIMYVMCIILIFYCVGSRRTWSRRSRVAGEARCYRPDSWCIGRSVSSSHACWLAVVYSDRLSWWGCSHATNCWRGNFGRAWRWVMMLCFCSCQGGCFLQWILTRNTF